LFLISSILFLFLISWWNFLGTNHWIALFSAEYPLLYFYVLSSRRAGRRRKVVLYQAVHEQKLQNGRTRAWYCVIAGWREGEHVVVVVNLAY